MADRASLESEKEQLVKEMAEMQKEFISKPFDPASYYASDEMKQQKTIYHEKAVRVSQIANELMKL